MHDAVHQPGIELRLLALCLRKGRHSLHIVMQPAGWLCLQEGRVPEGQGQLRPARIGTGSQQSTQILSLLKGCSVEQRRLAAALQLPEHEWTICTKNSQVIRILA